MDLTSTLQVCLVLKYSGPNFAINVQATVPIALTGATHVHQDTGFGPVKKVNALALGELLGYTLPTATSLQPH